MLYFTYVIWTHMNAWQFRPGSSASRSHHMVPYAESHYFSRISNVKFECHWELWIHTRARQSKVVNNGSLCFIVGDILGGKLNECKLSGMLFLEIVLIFPVASNDIHLNRKKTKRAFQAIFPMFNSQWDVINVSGIANEINLMQSWLKIESKTYDLGYYCRCTKQRKGK